MTPYEQGKIKGQWTLEQVHACGFTSAQKCLECQEQVYQQGLADLPKLAAMNLEYATRQAEYLESLISFTRVSLYSLIEQEEKKRAG